jgi:hypothetical protein
MHAYGLLVYIAAGPPPPHPPIIWSRLDLRYLRDFPPDWDWDWVWNLNKELLNIEPRLPFPRPLPIRFVLFFRTIRK